MARDAVPWRGFYAIVDPEHCLTRAPIEVAEAILSGGCAVLQLRDKRGDDRATLALARALRSRCAARGVPFVMNDRVDLALLTDADGLHLGQDDLPLSDARSLFRGPIGVSTHSLEQAHAAEGAGADLVGFGPVFSTTAKRKPDPVVGLATLEGVSAALSIPVVAIGGLSAARAAQAQNAGAALVAAISAVCSAPDPAIAAAAFHQPFQEVA